MSNKGAQGHVKRIAANRFMRISRKLSKYVTLADPGRHSGETSVALITVLKEKIGAASNSREARKIIRTGCIEVNNRQVREEKYPLGISDVIHLKGSGEYYRITVARQGMFGIERTNKAALDSLTLKVTGKYVYGKKRLMIRLNNNEVMPAGDNAVKVNDSVVIKGSAVEKVLKFEKGAKCTVISGMHAPASGEIVDIISGTQIRKPSVTIKSGDETFETLVGNIMVIGA